MNKLFLFNEAILIAVRDFLKFIIILGVTLVSTNTIFSTICPMYKIIPFLRCCMKYFTKSFLYFQQGSKSLKIYFLVGNIKMM